MKKIILALFLISTAFLAASAQGDKKAQKDSLALIQFEKALAAIEAKDFVIIVDYYEASGGTYETNTDVANFLSYEKDYVLLQGQIVAGNAHTNKMEVSNFTQTTDKKGNVRISMQLTGFFLNAKVDISLSKKAGRYADVIITPTKGDIKRFSGDVVPRAESKYFKRTGEI